MALLLLTSTIPAESGLPEDHVVNTLHFGTTANPASGIDKDDIADAVTDFFGTIYLANLAASHDGNNAVIRMYDLADAIPRNPVYEAVADYGPSGTGSLPSEVALCLSFHSAYVSGEPNARKRNRIYCGPWDDASSVATGSDVSRPAAGLITNMQTAGDALIAASDAAANWSWISVSKFGGPAVSTGAVVEGWVDNAWDTQRRRGSDATQRTVFS